MKTQRSIRLSRWVYSRLLGLYPAVHRSTYGADMLQLFSDQCHDARSRSPLALIGLWLRTLADLLVSAVREHLTSKHDWRGFMEAVPNSPLPWGGVALVLLPGLAFFIAQVAQLTGQDWFFLLSYRAGYFAIIPVLIVWVWKRKFPIWGLMPLGLFIKTGLEFAFRLQMLYLEETNSFYKWWLDTFSMTDARVMRAVVCGVMILTILALLWQANRRARVSRATWMGLGAYVLIIAFLSIRNASYYMDWLQDLGEMEVTRQVSTGLINIGWDVFDSLYYVLYDHLGLLILILLGTLLARRHGRLATLLPLGYLLPTVIFGRVADDWPVVGDPSFTFMLAVSATALAYRFLVAIAGPLWIVRSASNRQQKQASTVSLLTLVGMQMAFNLSTLFIGMNGAVVLPEMFLDISLGMVARQLVLAAAVFLAIQLYDPVDTGQMAREVLAG